MTMFIGKQDTLDEEMMYEYSHQIEIHTACQSYGLDINKDAANTEEIRELTDTKMDMFYMDMRAQGHPRWRPRRGTFYHCMISCQPDPTECPRLDTYCSTRGHSPQW